MSAKLKDLLTNSELKFIQRNHNFDTLLNSEEIYIKDIKVNALKVIALAFLLEKDTIPSIILPAFAIEELTKRAVEKNIKIFD